MTRPVKGEKRALKDLERGLRALVPGFYHRCPLCKAKRPMHARQDTYHSLLHDPTVAERKCELSIGEREVLRLLAELDAR